MLGMRAGNFVFEDFLLPFPVVLWEFCGRRSVYATVGECTPPPVVHLTFLVQVLEQFSFQLEWGVGVAPSVEPSSWHKLDLALM